MKKTKDKTEYVETYLAHLIDIIEYHQRPRPDGSINWNSATPDIEKFLRYIDKLTTQNIIENDIKDLESELEIQIKVQEKAKEIVVFGRARVGEMVADKYTRIGKIETLKELIDKKKDLIKVINT